MTATLYLRVNGVLHYIETAQVASVDVPWFITVGEMYMYGEPVTQSELDAQVARNFPAQVFALDFHTWLRENPLTAKLTAADVTAVCDNPDGDLPATVILKSLWLRYLETQGNNIAHPAKYLETLSLEPGLFYRR